MRRSDFFHLVISITMILSLLAGCSGSRLTPTVTAVPPTRTPVVAASTPSQTPTTANQAEPGAPGLGDSLYPQFGNGGYDVQHYTLDLIVKDVATSELSGDTTIDAIATQNLSSFNLDFIGFQISTITVNGQSAAFRRSGQELTITPAAPLTKNESFTVEVQYQGVPGELGSAAIPVQTGWIRFKSGSFVVSEPEGAATFYPVNDHPLDKASYTFRVTVPKPWDAAANGIQTQTIDQTNTTTFVFEEREPMASYLTTVDISKFDLETSEAKNGIPIRNYFPMDLPKNIRQPFESQGDMLVYFSDMFGPYPFETYGSLVVDARFGAALENQTMSVFSIEMIDPNHLEQTEEVIAHELAHQWFGDSVSLADWGDIWLNESFATYAQGLWVEHTQGRAGLDQWVRKLYAFVTKYRNTMSPPGKPPADNLFNEGVYYWGALGLHALRLEVGDEKFFEILKTYYQRFQGGNARTSDFIAVAEEVSGKDLTSFFDSWLYSDKMPPIPSLGLGTK